MESMGGVAAARSPRHRRRSEHRVRHDDQMDVDDADGPLSDAELLELSRLLARYADLSWTSSTTGGSSQDSVPCSWKSRVGQTTSPVGLRNDLAAVARGRWLSLDRDDLAWDGRSSDLRTAADRGAGRGRCGCHGVASMLSILERPPTDQKVRVRVPSGAPYQE